MPPEDISSPRGCNGLAKYSNKLSLYEKGTPIHVKGAILYNHYLKEKNLTKKYPLKVVNNSLQLDPAKFVDMKQNQGPQEVVSKLKLLFIKLKNDETLKSLPSRYISYDLKQQMNSYKSWSEEAGAPELSDFFKQIDQAVVDREEKDRSDKEEAARVQAEKNKAARNKGQFWPNKLDSLIRQFGQYRNKLFFQNQKPNINVNFYQ